MPTTYKVLGQANPAATTDTTLYSAPIATNAIVSTLSVCNQSAATVSYRIAVRPAGAALAAKHYLAYDAILFANDTAALTLGLTLAEGDVVTVRASSATVSFGLYGSEVVA